MAIDLDAIKRKLNQLQTTGNRRQTLWRPEPGKQVIRIVPYQHDRANPFQELYFHYNLGKKNFLSLRDCNRCVSALASDLYPQAHMQIRTCLPVKQLNSCFFCARVLWKGR